MILDRQQKGKTMDELYDAVVIGGGVAGLSTAANVTEGNVLLLDKDKIRTKEKRYTRFAFLNSMDRFGLSNCILAKYDVLSYRSTSGSTFDFHFDDFEILLLDLGKIHGTLKNHVEKVQGIREGVEIIDVEQNNHKIDIKISKNNNIETISAKYLIDASGNDSFTRKKFNLKCPELYCPCLSAPFKSGYKGESNVITFILPTDQFKSGGWIFPVDARNYTLGIADALKNIVSPTTLEKQFNNIQKHQILEDLIKGGFREDWDMGIIPVGISYPLVFNRICYIGDIIGQVNPWDMNGIRPILESSIMCANAINLALKYENESLLENYQDNWNSTYGPEYNTYNHWRKWTKSTEEWERTSMRRMLDDFKKYGQEHLLNRLRYYNMPVEGRNYLENLKSRFSQ